MKKVYILFFACCLLLNLKAQYAWQPLAPISGLINTDPPITESFYTISLTTDTAGHLYIGGFPDTNNYFNVWEWGGTNWIKLGGANPLNSGYTSQICSDPSGNIYTLSLSSIDGSAGELYKWDGSAWSAIGGNPITAVPYLISPLPLCSDANGNIYVGNYTTGFPLPYVSEWNGSSWSSLPGYPGAFIDTTTSIPAAISALYVDKNGIVYEGGGDTSYLAYTYSPNAARQYLLDYPETGGGPGGGGNSAVNDWDEAMASDSAGNIFIPTLLSQYGMPEWNGQNWNLSSSGILDSLQPDQYIVGIPFNTVCNDQEGNVYTCPQLKDQYGNYVMAKWNGVTWSQVGNDVASPFGAICVSNKGIIYATISLNNIGYVYYYGPETATAVDALQQDISVKAYPNPFTDITHIVVNGLDGNFDFELYDVTGRLQLRMPGLQTGHFDVSASQLPAGLYLYRLVTAKGQKAFGKLIAE